MKPKGSPVEDYLGALPGPERSALDNIREIVRTAVPDAVERISYGIIVFAHQGDLVGLGAQKKHLSFYVMSPALVDAMRDQLEPYEVAGAATIHFTPADPLPDDLLGAIVAARVEENMAKKRGK